MPMMPPPNQAFQANYMKRALALAVTFAPFGGELQTLEGKVQYAAGDALMTGVLGEHWPIRRQTFESSYEPCDLQSMGADGNYRKRATPVFARQLTQAHIMKLDGERGDLSGAPGDWIVQDGNGRSWVVADSIFQITYATLELDKV